jgi:hypothetical protein
MEQAEHVARTGVISNEYQILVRKYERKRPYARFTRSRRWEGNIKTDLKIVECGDAE